MYCYKSFTATAMSAAMLLSLSAGEVYVYKYDSAGNIPMAEKLLSTISELTDALLHSMPTINSTMS